MKYIIDIPDNLKPMDMLDCDTDDAVRMLMSAKPLLAVWASGAVHLNSSIPEVQKPGPYILYAMERPK